MAAKDELGRLGESLAAHYLERAGFEILDRNWRCSQGEVDLVTREGGETVFVEVKTRSSTAFGHPFEAITGAKLNRLRKLAGAWREANPDQKGPYRIDGVAVHWAGEVEPEIEHLRGLR